VPETSSTPHPGPRGGRTGIEPVTAGAKTACGRPGPLAVRDRWRTTVLFTF